ncbi:hypothetical protein TNCV_3205941 [Trichonephila clavipes]|nr:hypothetical protein TNCV_3205941 [Trichonephila clavipes]
MRCVSEDFDDQPSDVLHDAEVRWLSRGVVFERFMELFHEIVSFLSDCGRNTRTLKEAKQVSCVVWLFSDITGHLNDLNTKLKGKNSFDK